MADARTAFQTALSRRVSLGESDFKDRTEVHGRNWGFEQEIKQRDSSQKWGIGEELMTKSQVETQVQEQTGSRERDQLRENSVFITREHHRLL